MKMKMNRNRGYQNLRVWNDAIYFYQQICDVFLNFPFGLKRISSQEISSSDSIHRNISEGYCRRSLKEYLNFLNIALGSLGESVSGLHACRKSGQITEESFVKLDNIAFKLENELLSLIRSLEKKRDQSLPDNIPLLRDDETCYALNNSIDDPITPLTHLPNTDTL
jgi:four helix bundle protein